MKQQVPATVPPPAATPAPPTPSLFDAAAQALTPTKLDWATQTKYDAVRRILLGTTLALGSGVGLRGLHEALYAPKPRELGQDYTPRQRRKAANATPQAATTATVPRAAAELLQMLPPALPGNPGGSWWAAGVGLPAAAAAWYAGWKGTDHAFDTLRKFRLQRETQRARQDYDQMVSDYYRAAMQKHASDLAEAYSKIAAGGQPAATPIPPTTGGAATSAAPVAAGALPSAMHLAGGLYLASILGAGYVGHARTFAGLQSARERAAREVQRARAEQRRQTRDMLPLNLLDGITAAQ